MIHNQLLTDLTGQGFDLGAFIKKHGPPHYPTKRNPVGRINQKFWAELFAIYNQVFHEGTEAQYYKYRDPGLITADPLGIYEPFARELLFNQIANDIRQAALSWPGYDVLEQFTNARDINAIMSHTDGLLYKKGRLSVLVRAWQKAPAGGLKDEWWALFCNETADWLFAIIRSFRADLSPLGSADDIRVELVLHLHQKVLPAYRPGRGRLFSLVTAACHRYILTLLDKQRRQARRHVAAANYADDDAPAAEPEIDAIVWLEPEVGSVPFEIRERIELFTAPRADFELWLTANLLVYALGRDRGRAPLPTLEQIARIVSEIVSIPEGRAFTLTRAAMIELQKLLSDFRGRPSLYVRNTNALQMQHAEPVARSLEFDYSWQ